MNKKHLFYIGIILFPFFASKNAGAQDGVRRQRYVAVNQTIVDGKVISSDTIIFDSDTVRQRTVQSKEISMELPYTKGTTLHIDNTYRKLNIRQSTDNKVRLSTTTFYYAQPPFTNEQWFEKLNIGVKNTDTGILIVSGAINKSNSRNLSGYSYENSLYDTARANYQSSGNGWTITQNGASRETKMNGMTVTQNGAYHKVKIDTGALKGTTITQNGAHREVKQNGTTFTQDGAYQSYTSGVPDAPMPPVATSPTGVQKNRTPNGTNIYGRAITNGNFATGSWINSGEVVAVFDEKGNTFYNSTTLKRELTIYVPAGVKLNITSKYADVVVDHDVSSIKANISNASLDILNATDATIRSIYGTVSAGNLTNADITSTSGKVFVKDVARLQLNTRYTKVEAGNCGWLKTHSISDDYDIDEVKNFEGEKTYGSLRVDKLTGSFNLKGSSADMKIRNIESSVSAITLDNKYADVRLPVASLKNYEVVFTGNYSNVFAPFDRKDDTAQNNAVQRSSENFSYTTSGGTVASKTKPGTVPQNQSGTVWKNNDNQTVYTTSDGSVVSAIRPATAPRSRTNNFTATVGDTKGIHTIFKLVCNSCTVDFK